MKKRILSICLIVCLLAVAIGGATLAYFTDTDAQTNVMTTGKVNIVQLEKDKVGNDFVQNAALLPMVDARADKNASPVVDGYFDPAMKNVVDKVITVKNEAAEGAVNQDAYVRTILAFETNNEYAEGTSDVLRDGKEIFKTYIGYLGDFELLNRDPVVVDRVQYVLAVKVYDTALAPQQETTPSLKQLFLSPDANNEVALLFGDEYTVLALSQATQTAGFDSAKEALDTAFGELETMDEAELVGWLSAVA